MLPLGKLVPPDPSEKWETIKSALDDDAKTRRLTKLLLVSSIPVLLCIALAAGALLVWALGR